MNIKNVYFGIDIHTGQKLVIKKTHEMYVEEVQLLERDQGAIVDQTSISKMEE
jgi:hypothetical protein